LHSYVTFIWNHMWVLNLVPRAVFLKPKMLIPHSGFLWVVWSVSSFCEGGHREVLDVGLPQWKQVEELDSWPLASIDVNFEWTLTLWQADQPGHSVNNSSLAGFLIFLLTNSHNTFLFFLLEPVVHSEGGNGVELTVKSPTNIARTQVEVFTSHGGF